MVRFVYNMFYQRSLLSIIILMIVLVIIWTLLERLFRVKFHKKLWWKIGNGLFFVGIAIIIVTITLSARSSSVNEVILMPFHSFVEARTNPEMYRSMLMNIFMFFPLGLTMTYALPEKCSHKVILVIIFAFIFSFIIEFLQYYYHLGRVETDDVLCNTLGCAIGTLSYVIGKKYIKNTST